MRKNCAMAAPTTREDKYIMGADFEYRYSRWIRFPFCLILVLMLLTVSLSAGDIGRSDRISVIHAPNGGEPVEAKASSDGTIHLLYESKSDGIPYYVKSSNGGLTFSSAIPVVDRASQKPGLIFSGEAMTVGKSDSIYVAMSTNNWKLKLAGVAEGLSFATLAPRARAFAPVRSLNGQPSEGFSLAADEKGDVVATWLADKLYVNFSRDGGKTFTPNAELNSTYDPCNCCTTRTVYGTDGSLAVLYREETKNQRDMYVVILKKDGQQLRTRISSTLWEVNACPMTYFSLAATQNGYLAAWPTKGEIYFARMDRNGKVVPPGEVKTPGRTGMRTGVLALEAPDGQTLVAWKHQGELSWQLYSPDGHPQDAPHSIASVGSGTGGIVDKAGKFILFQ